jgi:hypothetical protein
MDEAELVELVREVVHAHASDVTEQRMFGSAGFLVAGNLAIGAGRRGLLVRVGAEDYDELADEPGATKDVMPGRHMRGWLRVDPDELPDEAELVEWIVRGVGTAASLPPKPD